MICPLTVSVFASVGAASATTTAAVDSTAINVFMQSPLSAVKNRKSLSPPIEPGCQESKLSRRFSCDLRGHKWNG
jgi:hypothetical protein